MAAFSPRSKRGRKLAQLRAEAEAAVEQLLALLDDLDGDPDLEPSLGSLENHPSDHRLPNFWGELVGHFTGTRRGEGSQLCWSEEADGGDDAEDEHDGCEDSGDDEPSLGSINLAPGRRFVDGNAAWPDQVAVIDGGFDQEHWALGSSDDCEGEHDGREDRETGLDGIKSPSWRLDREQRRRWA